MIDKEFVNKLKKRLSKKQRQLLIYLLRIELARKSFYYYCKALFPKFYQDDTPYLRIMCDTLQKVYEKKIINTKTGEPFQKLILNAPPRHFKSLTITLFQQWMMGSDRTKSSITGCYNTVLSTKFARGVRDGIEAIKPKNSRKIVFSDVFPNTRIKKGYGAVGEWALNDSQFNFLATSFKSSLTGFGASGAFVIDDQINNAEEAKNDRQLSEQWDWFCNTMLSRLEGDCLLIVNMTRWSKMDICGMIEQSDDIENWLILKFEVKNQKTGEMLNYRVMNEKKYNTLKKFMAEEIFMANFHQKPVDTEGRLYKHFKTYDELPVTNFALADVRFMADPSDGRNDHYAGMAYLLHQGFAYVLDIYYTSDVDRMKPALIGDFIVKNGCKKHKIECNKSVSFKQDIETELLARKYDYPKVDELWTKGDKLARIKAGAFWVQEAILFPKGWDVKYPLFFAHLKSFYGNGRDKFDDAPDLLSMVKEEIVNKPTTGEPKVIIIKDFDYERYTL